MCGGKARGTRGLGVGEGVCGMMTRLGRKGAFLWEGQGRGTVAPTAPCADIQLEISHSHSRDRAPLHCYLLTNLQSAYFVYGETAMLTALVSTVSLASPVSQNLRPERPKR